jgi:WD40 repeat protein
MSENLIAIMDGLNHFGIDKTICGIFKSHEKKISQSLQRKAVNVKYLSNQIWYAPSVMSVQDISQYRQWIVEDVQEVETLLEPVQHILKNEILSSSIILMPEKMHKAFTKNPWEVLTDIRPFNLAILSDHPHKIPVLFTYQGIQYIGWQMSNRLPQLFDCQYNKSWAKNLLDFVSPSIKEELDENQYNFPNEVLYTLEGHHDWVNSIAFSPNGKLLASGSEDNTIKLWEVKTGATLRTLKKRWWRKGHDAPVRSVAFSPDGKILASGSDDNTVKLWDIKTGKVLRSLPGNGLCVKMVLFSPDGQTLASENEMINLWDIQTGKALYTLKGQNGIAFSSDGHLLASEGQNNTIKLWSLKTGKELNIFKRHSDSIVTIAFSPNNRLLASGSEDETIKLWEVKTGKNLYTLIGHQHAVLSLTFSPDGHFLASASGDNTIKLWEVEKGQEISTLQEHKCQVNSVAYSPDGKLIASGSNDQTIKLWKKISLASPLG